MVTLDGPGYDAMTTEGFRRAKPEEIARDFGAVGTEPVTAEPPAPVVTEPPPTPVDDDPT